MRTLILRQIFVSWVNFIMNNTIITLTNPLNGFSIASVKVTEDDASAFIDDVFSNTHQLYTIKSANGEVHFIPKDIMSAMIVSIKTDTTDPYAMV